MDDLPSMRVDLECLSLLLATAITSRALSTVTLLSHVVHYVPYSVQDVSIDTLRNCVSVIHVLQEEAQAFEATTEGRHGCSASSCAGIGERY
ncbi:hypothetical protein BC827DRAFT_636016 [Russula dissimulans]|nr:hypothetical protein BC827DRAFT_636016 [Russula dissimulans]